MKYTLGFSPCPNDTFIFDALVNNKIETDGLKFDVVLEDVETLNQWAIEGRLDITKLSFPAFFLCGNNYILLNSGSAIGNGVGPLLIKKETKKINNIENCSIAIPGKNTTANLLLSFAYPNAKNKTPLLFSKIEDAVINEETDLGIIIHENRFTYKEKGLEKIADLGKIWEDKTKLPIPLGGIAIKTSIEKSISLKIDSLIKQSLEFAFSNYPIIPEYVKQNAQAMQETVMRQHIELYVNDYSLSLGDEGKKAINELNKIFKLQHLENTNKELFPLSFLQ